ncbi:MAG: histidinol-phosphate aminotransferase family protein [Bacteroidota bacterium]|nr:histidinol-phosphate aminotransferase family protein [Bacteroidota bacterium]
MSTSRRQWLRQSSLALASLGFASDLLAETSTTIKSGNQKILLNSNENAYGPSPMARKAILDAYTNTNRYPDDYILLLKKKIASHWNIDTSNILLGAGSSEIIGLAALHVRGIDKEVLVGDPAYKVWNGQAEHLGLSMNRIPLNNNRVHDLQQMLSSINSKTGMVYICNPNNPTGTVNDITELRKFTEEASKKTLVFIDEAYTEYADLPSLADLAINNKNIIVAKTFSKVYGLAGARVGYAIAHPDMIDTLGGYQPWPDSAVSLISAVAAMASLDDTKFVAQCKAHASETKEICYAAFNDLKLNFIPSQTNFILFNIDSIQKDFVKEMESQNIYVQFRAHFGGKWCRVSMGTVEEMQTFCRVLKTIV